ncbi:hypothetical protein CR970_00310 [Candidatus Saccharibacteria bacterium]|nr:MAG: hypothetical protein CR970_00310 [Candidatus Saccharibacteria bacterium]
MKRIKGVEGERLEFKSCKGAQRAMLPRDLWKNISAFANTRGGSVFLGVDDSGICEDLNEKDLDRLQRNASSLINEEFNKRPNVEIINHGAYVELKVAESPFYDKPIFSKKRGEALIFIRQGSTTVKADDSQKRSMFASASGGGENRLVDCNVHDSIDSDKVNTYCQLTGLRGIEGLNIADKLRKLKAIRDGKLTNFGLIAFGRDDVVDDHLSNVYIDFKYFRGKSKVDDDLEDIYRDRKEFHGDIKQQFEAAFAYLMDYIKKDWPVGGRLNKQTGLREDVYIMSEDAFREALANAVAHRDYAIETSCVNIDLYEDRVEMTNPGESLVAIDDLEKTESRARNPILMEFLKTYRVTDKSARGILTIKQAARKQGLLDPTFENISGSFRATLHFSSPYSTKDKAWVDQLAKEHSLRDTQKNALVFVRNNGEISNKKYCEINHMESRNDDRKARRELADMADKGLLHLKGRGPGTRYVL